MQLGVQHTRPLETLNLHTAHTASGHWRSSHQTNFKITLQLQPCSKGSKLYCGMAYMTDQYPALEHVKPIKLNYDYAVSTDTSGQSIPRGIIMFKGPPLLQASL